MSGEFPFADRTMIKIIENEIDIETYLMLRASVGWKQVPEKQAERAIINSLITLLAVDEAGMPLGMGRLVGDGAYVCYIQDLIVVPRAQGTGVGSALIKRLTAFCEELKIPDTTMMLCLMCAKGREPFYEKHGFLARPTESLGPGMIQYL